MALESDVFTVEEAKELAKKMNAFLEDHGFFNGRDAYVKASIAMFVHGSFVQGMQLSKLFIHEGAAPVDAMYNQLIALFREMVSDGFVSSLHTGSERMAAEFLSKMMLNPAKKPS